MQTDMNKLAPNIGNIMTDKYASRPPLYNKSSTPMNWRNKHIIKQFERGEALPLIKKQNDTRLPCQEPLRLKPVRTTTQQYEEIYPKDFPELCNKSSSKDNTRKTFLDWKKIGNTFDVKTKIEEAVKPEIVASTVEDDVISLDSDCKPCSPRGSNYNKSHSWADICCDSEDDDDL